MNAPRTVLVVDDDPHNRTIAADGLRFAGFEVLEAGDGERGLGLALGARPDAVVLDLSLPGLDGWTVAHRLRSEARARRPAIVALTAHAMVGDAEAALEAGCDRYVPKPFDPFVLARVVEEAIAAKEEKAR